MVDFLHLIPEEEKNAIREESMPLWMDPMLATLTKHYFSDENWIFERKFDGERVIAYKDGARVRLCSRNKQNLNATFPEIEAALLTIEPKKAVLDGEIVAFEGSLTSFSRLQKRIKIRDRNEARKSGVSVKYYLFDILYLEGWNVSSLSLRLRKSLLKQVISYSDPLRFTPHRNQYGESYYQKACRKGWEGILAKNAHSPYIHSRSREWLKFKCTHRQEFVIGGYTEPKGSRIGFGALLLGYYEDDKLMYAGRVGTGFDDELLRLLSSRFASIEQETSPFFGHEADGADVHFVQPTLVAEIGFTEWTTEGKLRHPRFEGLRFDKDPHVVMREKPE